MKRLAVLVLLVAACLFAGSHLLFKPIARPGGSRPGPGSEPSSHHREGELTAPQPVQSRAPEPASTAEAPSRLVLFVRSAGSGDPLPGTWVAPREALSDPSAREPWTLGTGPAPAFVELTAEDGSCSFVLSGQGEEQFLVKRPGALSREEAVVTVLDPGSGVELTRIVELPTQTGLFFGRVVDRLTGNPLPDIGVHAGDPSLVLRALVPESVQADPVTTTDELGVFALPWESWRGTAIGIRSDGFAPLIDLIEEGHEDPTQPQVLPLSRGASLTVEVLGATDTPIPGTRVDVTTAWRHLFPRGGVSPLGRLGLASWSSDADKEGRVVQGDLPPDVPLDLRVIATGFPPKQETITLEPGSSRHIRVSLSPTVGTVRGEVSWSNGESGSGLQISLVPTRSSTLESVYEPKAVDEKERSIRADEDGRFLFEDVELDSWWVGVRHGGRHAPVFRRVALSASRPDVYVRLELERGSFLEGRVVGPEGTPMAGADVDLVSEAPSGRFTTVSDAKGHFRIGPLASGPVLLTASAPLEPGVGPSDTVEVHVGSTRSVELQLTGGGTITGTVIGAPYSEREAVEFHAVAEDPSRSGSQAIGLMAAEGMFFIPSLRAGAYTVFCATPRGWVGWTHGVVVPEGGDPAPVELELVPGARVRVQASGREEPCRVTTYLGSDALRLDTLEPGRSLVLIVPAGTLTLTLEDSKGQLLAEEQARVDAGQEHLINFL